MPDGFSLENAESPGIVADTSKIVMLDVFVGISKDKKTLVYKRKYHIGGDGKILFPKEAYSNLKAIFDAFYKSDSATLTLRQDSPTATTSPATKTN